MNQFISLFLKGLAMGAANVIPGVSGGTIALITGIYERLIQAVKSIDLASIQLLFKGQIKALWEKVDGNFLLAVFAGIGISLITLAKLFKFFMEDEIYSIWLMAFFFGLILVSIFSVGRTIQNWSPSVIAFLILGLVAATGIALLNPLTENEAIWYLLICGVVAMCSMILPGLSGSFVLIILGNYKLVMLDAVSDFKWSVLIPVAIGAGLGLIAFSRVLSWVFSNYRDQTISLMTGFIIGSMLIIWPWKRETYLTDQTGEWILKKGEKIVSGYEWFLPALNSQTFVAIALLIVGGLAIWAMERWAGQLSNE